MCKRWRGVHRPAVMAGVKTRRRVDDRRKGQPLESRAAGWHDENQFACAPLQIAKCPSMQGPHKQAYVDITAEVPTFSKVQTATLVQYGSRIVAIVATRSRSLAETTGRHARAPALALDQRFPLPSAARTICGLKSGDVYRRSRSAYTSWRPVIWKPHLSRVCTHSQMSPMATAHEAPHWRTTPGILSHALRALRQHPAAP